MLERQIKIQLFSPLTSAHQGSPSAVRVLWEAFSLNHTYALSQYLTSVTFCLVRPELLLI